MKELGTIGSSSSLVIRYTGTARLLLVFESGNSTLNGMAIVVGTSTSITYTTVTLGSNLTITTNGNAMTITNGHGSNSTRAYALLFAGASYIAV